MPSGYRHAIIYIYKYTSTRPALHVGEVCSIPSAMISGMLEKSPMSTGSVVCLGTCWTARDFRCLFSGDSNNFPAARSPRHAKMNPPKEAFKFAYSIRFFGVGACARKKESLGAMCQNLIFVEHFLPSTICSSKSRTTEIEPMIA